jgi:FAD/FMN-containing dehydrogenase/Fe-S oxidoreductase
LDETHRRLFATDASIYQERPLGVAFPKTATDIQLLVEFAEQQRISLIPRAGGTSLAGQCVGAGLVVDVSRHLNGIIHFDEKARTVSVQPGIIRDELNAFLKAYGLFFAPITSTANRATLGGMVGNNSCGTNSIVYGDTRRYVRKIKGILSDGSVATFHSLSTEALVAKQQLPGLEGNIYREIGTMLGDPATRESIRRDFPKASVTRRNTGYALDALLDGQPYSEQGKAFSLAPLLTGSEGTLMFMTEITLELVPLPPPAASIVAVHFASIRKAMEAVTVCMDHHPQACELMDRIILNCTRGNLKYQKTLQYFEGDPAAVLLVEFLAEHQHLATLGAQKLIDDLKNRATGYAYPIIEGTATRDIWALRSAGLGLLANIPGDQKGVACIEDTAVDIADLADYMEEFTELMRQFDQEVVYYAHAGAGEIHLRPILNLKTSEDRQKLYDITASVAKLVKKYGGSLSGEHGDGRVRAPFIPTVVGQANYARFKAIKSVFDPHNIFNPGKITDPAPMNEQLRYEPDQPDKEIGTIFDFSASGGMLRMAEKCNGSGDCRKLPLSGGTMCPSYHVTRQEQHTTRGRANMLRQLLTEVPGRGAFEREELRESLDLCLSCKGCTSECPSNVDMSTLKAEFFHQYYQEKGIPLRAWVFAHIARINQLGSRWPTLTNWVLSQKTSGSLLKKMLNIAPARSLPQLASAPLQTVLKKRKPRGDGSRGKLILFCDEFSNYNDVEVGLAAVQLLETLGYAVQLTDHAESGRAALSKGLLKTARKHAETNVRKLAPLVAPDCPLVGIEPSAILGFRDEYPKLVREPLRVAALELARNSLTVEEFLIRELRAFRISADDFDRKPRQLLVHGHCHQKALTEFKDVFSLLSLPAAHRVELLDTGCCGMAGSFGYEKEHYDTSMQIGELRLFPLVRQSPPDAILVASGTSCRHQLLDGTGVRAVHPVEVLLEAVNSTSA